MADPLPYHVVEVHEEGWDLQHEATCLPDCEWNEKFARWLESFRRTSVPAGRYQLTPLNYNGHFRLDEIDRS